MNEIKCPHDLNQFVLGEQAFEDTFPEEECEKIKFYGDCYHCFSTAIASRDYQLRTGRATEKRGRTVIDADKFLSFLIFSKHLDGLTCGEVKEAIEMCKVNVIDEIRSEIENDWQLKEYPSSPFSCGLRRAIEIIDKHETESEE